MRDGPSCTPQRDKAMMGATTPMLEGQPGFAQAWLYGRIMHLSISMKVFGDTKKSPKEAGTAPQYPRGPCIPALCKSRGESKQTHCSKHPRRLEE